ncbi:LysR substrate-binding domain-containing protein [Streptomyces sp. RB6PN25]|uniref:LysR substrate-binding domain-containing protein n=1 Tax=Streptomyces humicola TaxID=2953240 RepID=A0ABT1Q1H7_9ACTN|nr:LysR substrate-binding domain-containing protein [Streptomyces humicola]MCQ4082597.1 LysR substrate-binding domain-containing protein [Streptomyces humicola]
MRAGTVDLALTAPQPREPRARALRWRRLLTEPLGLAVPPDHRLAGRKRVQLAELADEPFVVLRSGMGLRTIVEEACRTAGFTPRIAFEGDEVATLRGLIGAGLGVSLLPAHHTEEPRRGERAHLISVVAPVCTREIGLAWLADRLLPPAARAFRDHVLRTRPPRAP